MNNEFNYKSQAKAQALDAMSFNMDNQAISSNQLIRQRKLKKLLKLCLICAPFAIFLYLFQIEPLLWVLVNSFKYEDSWSLENYRLIFTDDFILQAFYNSFYFSILSTIIALAIALIFINSLRKTEGKLKNSIISFVNVCSNFSGVPLAFACIIILGLNGFVTLILKDLGLIDNFSIYSRSGILFIYTYFQIPLAILLLYPAFDALKTQWYEAARILGASLFDYIFKIALPIILPSIIGTAIILIANALGAYASIYALTTGNYNILTIRIASLVSGDIYLDPNFAAAMSILLLVSMTIIVFVSQMILKRTYHAKNS